MDHHNTSRPRPNSDARTSHAQEYLPAARPLLAGDSEGVDDGDHDGHLDDDDDDDKDEDSTSTATDNDDPGHGSARSEPKWRQGNFTTRKPNDYQPGHEPQMTVREAMRAYPMAIFWCLAVSMCIIMEGYDTILIGNFFAFPQFQRKYGSFVGITDQTRSGYQVSPFWMAMVGNASGIGAFFGTLLTGYLVAIFGQKRVLIGALVMLSLFIFITFFAPNIGVLFVGQILCGLPWGVFATTAPAYSSEVLPTELRVFGTSWTNMCFIIGQLISAGVLRVCLEREDQWAYRIPFSVQWIWPAILVPVLCFAPESPWHLVRVGRLEDAETSLRKLRRGSSSSATAAATAGNVPTVKQALAAIVHTNALEEDLSVGTSYFDCFSGFELRRTEIACVCFAGQVLSGASFAYNASYFFEQVGLAAETTYSLNLGGTGLAFVGTLVNWFCLMPYFGRRRIYLVGMLVMAAELFLIGLLNVFSSTIPFVAMVQAGLTLVWTFTYQLTVGQLGWALSAEVGSTRLRQKTVCLARNAYYICSVAAGVLQPYFMNPEALNLRGYTGFVWGTTALITCLWAYFRLPETKGRSYEELDVLFARRVDARKFASTNVDALEGRRPNGTTTFADSIEMERTSARQRHIEDNGGPSGGRHSVEDDTAGLLARDAD
ncbi:MFS transporter [Exophiala viscosa]|uniref:MFS transporter n=1 Tax=Exophiala viscosa TaxID=2486360 RepID=A0AAN6IA38_9EURO|nr:MFS transporter [Exophiala viscosa]